MLNSKIVGALAVVAVLSTVGVGYAVSTSTVYFDGTASSGTVSIAWVESGTGAPTTSSNYGSASDCVASFSSTEITLTATDMVPPGGGRNAYCEISDSSRHGNSLNITNTGGFPVTLNDSVSCSPSCTHEANEWATGSGCWYYADSSTLGYDALPVTLSPGAVYPGTYGTLYGWIGIVSLDSYVSGCAGTTFSVTVTFTGASP